MSFFRKCDFFCTFCPLFQQLRDTVQVGIYVGQDILLRRNFPDIRFLLLGMHLYALQTSR